MACFPEKIGSSFLFFSNELGEARLPLAGFQLKDWKGLDDAFLSSLAVPFCGCNPGS